MNIRFPGALVALLLLVIAAHAVGAVPNGHFDPQRCYDPANPDPSAGDGALETSQLGTLVHVVLSASSVFHVADINCRHLDPRL